MRKHCIPSLVPWVDRAEEETGNGHTSSPQGFYSTSLCLAEVSTHHPFSVFLGGWLLSLFPKYFEHILKAGPGARVVVA